MAAAKSRTELQSSEPRKNARGAERMADRMPWMLALSSADQEKCAKELVDAARASFATDQPHLAAATLTAWRETAVAIAERLDWIEDGKALERP